MCTFPSRLTQYIPFSPGRNTSRKVRRWLIIPKQMVCSHCAMHVSLFLFISPNLQDSREGFEVVPIVYENMSLNAGDKKWIVR